MIFIEVRLWVDDHVTMMLLVNDPADMAEVEERVARGLKERFNGDTISHGIIDVDEAIPDGG